MAETSSTPSEVTESNEREHAAAVVTTVLGSAAPDFLGDCLALAKFMRLSLMKAAHAVLSSGAYRESGGREVTPVCFLLSS
jgi:hypothetical protein